MKPINFYSHKGGVGLTTIAAAFGVVYSTRQPTTIGTWSDDEYNDLQVAYGLAVDPGATTDVTDRLHIAKLAVPQSAFTDGHPAVMYDGTVLVTKQHMGPFVYNILVTRPNYMAIRRDFADKTVPDGIVVVTEPGSALSAKDASMALAAPVLADLPYDPSFGRCIDAGLLAARLPNSIAHPLALLVGSLDLLERDSARIAATIGGAS